MSAGRFNTMVDSAAYEQVAMAKQAVSANRLEKSRLAISILTPRPLTTITDRPGWFTRDEIIERYSTRSGRDLSNIHFYETFALFKIAVVIQQIYYRYVQGQTTDPRFAAFGARVEFLARHAAGLVERS